MDSQELIKLRLTSQQLYLPGVSDPTELISWMGALQAQDYAMAKWALGIRIPGCTDQEVAGAIKRGDIIRTHVMRPTWHLISSDDIYWMLDLTAPSIKASVRSRHRDLELTDKVLSKCLSIIQNELEGGNHCTREELMLKLSEAKIQTDLNRSSHIMVWAEMEGLVCSGADKEGKSTYALLEERVPGKKTLPMDEAAVRLAEKYFQSHGPATLKDFVWWSGLTVKVAGRALETIKPWLESIEMDSETYWMSSGLMSDLSKPLCHLLPAYDEFIISYKDRNAIIPPHVQRIAISENGLFRPVILLNGKAIGLWRRTVKKDRVSVEMEFFSPPLKKTLNLLQIHAASFARFLGKKLDSVSLPFADL
ncbi:MAG: winged helix DNA-binding domain-containing protein [Bacteroidetes bacterium]|nr:winged helix DNA-binding domain-containing protein [Bacteroidota bacterium]